MNNNKTKVIPLFDEFDNWTDKGRELDNEIMKAIDHIVNKYNKEGYSPRHIQLIIQGAANEVGLFQYI